MKQLKERYMEEILPAVIKEYKIENALSAPVPMKVTVNMGVGEALQDRGVLDGYMADIERITGQKPVQTKAKKNIADFSLRKGDVVGLKVTLRRDRMWHFIDKLVNVVLPRVRDFRGISGKSFDSAGTYTLGVTELVVFPEIDASKVTKTKGLAITITFKNGTKELSKDVMKKIGFIFKED